MQKAVSTYVYIKERLHPGLLDGLVRGGAQAIEIFAARQHLDYANRKQHVREIADWFRSTGIPLNSVHSPLYADYEFGRAGAPPVNVASTDRAGRIEAMDEVKRALEIAEQIPFRFLIQHLGTSNEAFHDRKFEAAMTSIEHFGHAHIMSNVAEAFEIVKPHVRSTHVHDNAKDRDAHLWPGEGSVNWKEAMELLRSAPNTPPLLLEIEHDDKVNPIEKMQPTFDKLETA